jgi:hypothetical protein
MVQRIYFHLLTIEENNERWYESDHGFLDQEKKELIFEVIAKFDSRINSCGDLVRESGAKPIHICKS